jgi:hypothetical protein
LKYRFLTQKQLLLLWRLCLKLLTSTIAVFATTAFAKTNNAIAKNAIANIANANKIATVMIASAHASVKSVIATIANVNMIAIASNTIIATATNTSAMTITVMTTNMTIVVAITIAHVVSIVNATKSTSAVKIAIVATSEKHSLDFRLCQNGKAFFYGWFFASLPPDAKTFQKKFLVAT